MNIQDYQRAGDHECDNPKQQTQGKTNTEEVHKSVKEVSCKSIGTPEDHHTHQSDNTDPDRRIFYILGTRGNRQHKRQIEVQVGKEPWIETDNKIWSEHAKNTGNHSKKCVQ